MKMIIEYDVLWCVFGLKRLVYYMCIWRDSLLVFEP